jgi:hypothetical protein
LNSFYYLSSFLFEKSNTPMGLKQMGYRLLKRTFFSILGVRSKISVLSPSSLVFFLFFFVF